MILIVSQLLFYFFFIPTMSSVADTLFSNQSLSGNQTLVSLAGNFEMGFFKPGNSPKYYIGIWYTNVKPTTVVWVANRETPVSDTYTSKLKIVDGNLVLLNESNIQIWSTNMISTDANSASVLLLDNGNLVLRYGSSSMSLVWQSFDHPTHTFLPGSKLGYNKRTNAKQVLTSWRSAEDPAMGLYSVELDQGQKQYVIKWNRSVEYWVSGAWNDENRTFSLIPEMRFTNGYIFSFVDNANESYFKYSFNNTSIFSRLTIDISGQIQQLSWDESSRKWTLFWNQPLSLCQVCGCCGAFGICRKNSLPFCNCLTAFKPSSQSDWNLNAFSGGCVRNTELKCRAKEEIHGFVVSYVPHEFPLSILGNKTPLLDELACRRSCLDDCNCNAYAFISKVCRHLNRENLNNVSLVFLPDNSTVTPPFELHIKVASKDLPVLLNKVGRKSNKVNHVAVIGSVVGVVFLLCLVLIIFYRKKRIMTGKTRMEGLLVVFAYRDLQIATKNFMDKLGGGAFGSVFKGVLHDSSIVAVKKLESMSQGEKQFRSEVSTLGTIQHVNLVRLRGFCTEGNSKLLVYDYMPNGSLHSHLFNEKQDSVLNWKLRYEIALGIARGLVYLHEKCRDCIIHCDIKPENILLDASFCPKIADFGLAKLVGRDFSRVLTTMRGTRGYLAPEWLSGVAVTAKADVYSYGRMLFELVSGKRNVDQSEDSSLTFFPSLVANVLMEGGDVLSLVDSRLDREASVEEVMKICKVACWCIQDEEDLRPCMSQVEQILEGVLEVNMPPIPRYLKLFADNKVPIVFFTESSSNRSSQVSTSSSCGDS